MAQTNFAQLLDHQKKVWSRDLWREAREHSFMMQFGGKGSNNMVENINNLTRSEKGDLAVIHLVPDLVTDGVAGDNQLKGNEEAIKAFDQTITIDQLRHGTRNTGRMADQRSVINFRENARDQLSYWLAERIDQMAILTLSGVGYGFHTNGVARVDSALPELAFAADVTAPSANRYFTWNADNGLQQGAANTDATFSLAKSTPSYEMLVQIKAMAKNKYIKGIKQKGNDESFHVFMTPDALAKLKMDSDFLANLRNAGVRGEKNQLFSGGASYYVDGLWIHEHRFVFNNSGLADGARWGASTDVTGCRMLVCGAQALAMADIGDAYWDEDKDDYNNNYGISVGKMFGFKKPVWQSKVDGTKEDFGVMTVDIATGGND